MSVYTEFNYSNLLVVTKHFQTGKIAYSYLHILINSLTSNILGSGVVHISSGRAMPSLV